MAITTKTITGKIVIPGTTTGIRAKVTATPMTNAQALTFPLDDVISWGPVVGYTDAAGMLPATFKIPTSSEQQPELLWKFVAEPVDKHSGLPKSWLMGHYSITGTGTIDLADLVDVDVDAFNQATFVTLQSLVASATAASQSAAASATSAASSASVANSLVTADLGTTDGQTWALLSDPNSQSSAAIRGSVGAPASVVVAASDTIAARGANFRCDGTDDQTTINAAIATLDPLKGGKVLLLAGEYNLSGPVVIDRSRVTLEGEGWGFWEDYVDGGPLGPATGSEGAGMTKLKATAAVNLVEINNASVHANAENRLAGVAIRNLYLYGFNNQGFGILCERDPIANNSTDQLVIERVFVHNTGAGMKVDADCPYIAYNTIMDVGDYGLFLGETVGVAGQVHHNVIADIGGDGIIVGAGAQFVEVSANILVRCAIGANIVADRATVTGNRVWDCREVGIEVHTMATVTGNTVRGCTGQQIAVTTGYTADGVIVAHNNVESTLNDNAGIYVVATPNCIIESNVVRAAALGGVDNGFGMVLTDADACIVRGNRIYCENASTAGTNVGLSVDAASASNAGIIADNLVTGGFGTRIDVPAATASFVVRDNIAVA